MDMAAKYPIADMALTRGIRLTTRGISVQREIIHILGVFPCTIKK
jgi:hypothetical protein